MNHEKIGKIIEKKIRSKKLKKTVKIKVKHPHVNKKPLARKRIFVQTPFSFSSNSEVSQTSNVKIMTEVKRKT